LGGSIEQRRLGDSKVEAPLQLGKKVGREDAYIQRRITSPRRAMRKNPPLRFL